MIRIRNFPEKNYRAIFTPDGQTLHMKHNGSEPYLELDYPEIYDVGINSKCFGECDYCYVEAMRTGVNFIDICEKASAFFGSMSMNERPFQIAIGGSGEPCMHPDFPEFLKTIRDLGIMPNYTTNGMHLSPGVLDATEKYAGGVAITLHNHLEKHWRRAIPKLAEITRLNLHIIPRSLEDIELFEDWFYEFKDIVDYFVLLPYQNVGFGDPIENIGEIYRYLFDHVLKMMTEEERKQIAYGAYFYEELQKRPWLKAGLYDHTAFSKYILFQDNGSLYSSSFDWQNPLKQGIFPV